MAIAGTIIIVNSQDYKKATKIAKSVREFEMHKSYLHVGLFTLKEHFIANINSYNKYLPALYGALSATARSGSDVVADICITDRDEFDCLSLFLDGLDVVWVNVGLTTEFVNPDLEFNAEKDASLIAKQILQFMVMRYKYANSYTRFALEFCDIPIAKKHGKIVLFTGCPSSGKSTLVKALQAQATEKFLCVGVDTYCLYYIHPRYLGGVPKDDNDKSFLQPNYNPNHYEQLGFSWIAKGPNQENPSQYMRMNLGHAARRAVSAVYSTIAQMSRLGFNVVSDHCFHFPDYLTEIKHKFTGLPVINVRLNLDLDIVKQREVSRGDRMEGMGESIYYQMIKDYSADLEINTELNTPEEGAKKVLEFINNKF